MTQPSVVVALGSAGISAAMWVVVGAPVAAGIASIRMSVWVIASLPEMAVTSAVLGALQGLLFFLCGHGRFKSVHGGFVWLGAFSGSLMGVLGFPPVFSQAGIIATRSTVAVLLLAAIMSGLAAGLVSAHVLTMLLWGRSMQLGWKIVALGLFIPGIIDYCFFRTATLERIAVPEVSRQDIVKLSAGNARGSEWTGCYEFRGKFPLNQGGEWGMLKIVQTDGVLQVKEGRDSLWGGVDRSGRFRFGAEVTDRAVTLRMLWQGKFHADSFEFDKRLTVVNGVNALGSNPVTGKGHLVACEQLDSRKVKFVP